MSRRASTFDRLALREQVLINRHMRGLGELNNEFQKINQMRQKLDEMARGQVPNDGATHNCGKLDRSEVQ